MKKLSAECDMYKKKSMTFYVQPHLQAATTEKCTIQLWIKINNTLIDFMAHIKLKTGSHFLSNQVPRNSVSNSFKIQCGGGSI